MSLLVVFFCINSFVDKGKRIPPIIAVTSVFNNIKYSFPRIAAKIKSSPSIGKRGSFLSGFTIIKYQNITACKQYHIFPKNTIFREERICIKGVLIPIIKTGCSPLACIKSSFLLWFWKECLCKLAMYMIFTYK